MEVTAKKANLTAKSSARLCHCRALLTVLSTLVKRRQCGCCHVPAEGGETFGETWVLREKKFALRMNVKYKAGTAAATVVSVEV
jgi:hypothetical protein